MKENFNLDESYELKDNLSFIDNGIIDSTGILELVAFIEDKFDIRIEDEELVPEYLDSIKRIALFIEKKKHAGQ